jgi:hypothetical protein
MACRENFLKVQIMIIASAPLHRLQRCAKYGAANATRTRCIKTASDIDFGRVSINEAQVSRLLFDGMLAAMDCVALCGDAKVMFKEVGNVPC